MYNARARDGANGLIFVRKIGGDYFGRAGRRLRIAADKAERLILCHEKCDEFVANGAA
jgi:hypothetical protein